VFHSGLSEVLGRMFYRVVERDIILKDPWNIVFLVYRFPRAFSSTPATVDTFVGADIELIREFLPIVPDILVDAINWTDIDTSLVDMIDAKTGYRPSHAGPISHLLFTGSSISPKS
jgi:hypothetical protein